MLNIVCEARKVSKSSYDLLKNPIESAISRIQPVTSDVMWSTITSPQRKMKKSSHREGRRSKHLCSDRAGVSEEKHMWTGLRMENSTKFLGRQKTPLKLPFTPGYRPASELSSHKFFFLLPIDEENKLKKKKTTFLWHKHTHVTW